MQDGFRMEIIDGSQEKNNDDHNNKNKDKK